MSRKEEIKEAIEEVKQERAEGIQIFIVPLFIGLATYSWWVALISFVVILLIAWYGNTTMFAFMHVAFVISWGVAGWWIGKELIENVGAAITLALFGLFVGFGLNHSPIKEEIKRKW